MAGPSLLFHGFLVSLKPSVKDVVNSLSEIRQECSSHSFLCAYEAALLSAEAVLALHMLSCIIVPAVFYATEAGFLDCHRIVLFYIVSHLLPSCLQNQGSLKCLITHCRIRELISECHLVLVLCSCSFCLGKIILTPSIVISSLDRSSAELPRKDSCIKFSPVSSSMNADAKNLTYLFCNIHVSSEHSCCTLVINWPLRLSSRLLLQCKKNNLEV